MNSEIPRVYDCFNGDADGICALIQWRKVYPVSQNHHLITGVKRDIALASQVIGKGADQLVIFDISFDKNRESVMRLLAEGVHITYIDHHYVGESVKHPNLTAFIDTAPTICTSLLVNKVLNNAYYHWAIVGALGDNLQQSAKRLAVNHSLPNNDFKHLKKLGIYINYNGYGGELNDLHFHPKMLYRHLCQYDNPLDFIDENGAIFDQLEAGYYADMAQAEDAKVIYSNSTVNIVQLPNKPWARRVSGVFINKLANASPQQSHAVITSKKTGDYQVSVRASLKHKIGADQLCRHFPTGGGRAAAGGINTLKHSQLGYFIDYFKRFFDPNDFS